jgi:hypothetical protein
MKHQKDKSAVNQDMKHQKDKSVVNQDIKRLAVKPLLVKNHVVMNHLVQILLHHQLLVWEVGEEDNP